MSHLREKGYPHPEGGESCGSDCLVHGLITCFTGLGWILQIPLRGHVRERYRVRGSGFGDWSVFSLPYSARKSCLNVVVLTYIHLVAESSAATRVHSPRNRARLSSRSSL